jgi:hypothetical protein
LKQGSRAQPSAGIMQQGCLPLNRLGGVGGNDSSACGSVPRSMRSAVSATPSTPSSITSMQRAMNRASKVHGVSSMEGGEGRLQSAAGSGISHGVAVAGPSLDVAIGLSIRPIPRPCRRYSSSIGALSALAAKGTGRVHMMRLERLQLMSGGME